MESIIRDKIVKHAEENMLFTTHQHGFSKKRSCLTNLLETLESWTEALEEGYGVDVIFLDYQKAFDTVPHRRLLHKLKTYGIAGNLLKWIEGFLTLRKMRVAVNGANADWATVTSGVPQGSVLGPLLFLLYVNDLASIVKSNVKMFADDTKIWAKIKENEDAEQLKQDLSKLGEWSDNWLLKFNLDKCKVMHIGHDLNIEYCLRNGQDTKSLSSTKEERDLGINITNDLKWVSQCSKAANKAMSTLGIIKRNFKYLDRESFIILYNTYIRPHLEYCVQVWAPYFKKDIACLEKVQRRATKLVHGFSKLGYDERLKRLGLFSLEQRRKRGDLIETFKILNGYENIECSQFFEMAGTSHLRGNSFKLYKKRTNKKCRT
jgi:ribonuclease P/MRP protein subunit RPP40